jgi:EmrB/QacA subfamily drug resistance transporter
VPSPAAPPPFPTSASFTHRETIVILLGLSFCMFLAALDQTIVAVAVPQMAADLHGVELLSWIMSAYLLTSTAATPIYGKLSDLYGRRIMLQIALVIFFAASAMSALASSMGELILFRALMGVGGGGLISMSHAAIADVVSPRQRGRYQAYIAASFAISGVVGPLLGGLFIEHLSWRFVFWINIPLGLIALYASHRTLAALTAQRMRHRIDYIGAILIVSAVCCALMVTTMGGIQLPWTSWQIVALTVAAILLFGLCVLHERSTAEPILPPRLFSNTTFVLCNALNLLVAAVSLGGVVLVLLFLQMSYRLPGSEAAILIIPMTAMITIASIACGRLMAASGRYKIFPVFGTALTGTSMLLMALLSENAAIPTIGILIALAGIGMGLVGPVTIVVIQNSVELRDVGTATSSVSFFRSLGGACGVALLTAVLIASLEAIVPTIPGHELLGGNPGLQLIRAGSTAIGMAPAAMQPLVAGAISDAFQVVFLVAAAIAYLGFITGLMLTEAPLKTGKSSD